MGRRRWRRRRKRGTAAAAAAHMHAEGMHVVSGGYYGNFYLDYRSGAELQPSGRTLVTHKIECEGKTNSSRLCVFARVFVRKVWRRTQNGCIRECARACERVWSMVCAQFHFLPPSIHVWCIYLAKIAFLSNIYFDVRSGRSLVRASIGPHFLNARACTRTFVFQFNWVGTTQTHT